jgi:hypothetical protein
MKVKVNQQVKIHRLSEGLAVKAYATKKGMDLNVYSEALKVFQRDFDDSIEKNHSVLDAYNTIYSRVVESRLKIIQAVDAVSNFYLVDVMIEQMTEDALSPEIGSNEILEIKYPSDPKIEKELQRLERRLNLDQKLLDITPDMIRYGEYVLKSEIDTGTVSETPNDLGKGEVVSKKTKPKGLIALKDTVEQGMVVALTQDGEQAGYLGIDERGAIIRFENADFVKFTFGGARVRVRLEDQIPWAKSENIKKFLETLPRYVRVGRSVLYKFIPKIKELELLEKLVPATKLSKLSNVNIVGMNVPEQYDVDKGLAAAKRVENLINNKVGIDSQLKEITVESIVAIAGRTKVVPTFGDKGQLQKLDYKIDEADDMASSADELRKLICDSIGVPYELIYKSDGDANKGEILKRYARYLRRLKNIQRSLAEGVKQICSIHLANSGIDFKEDEIIVEFKNKLIEIDNLDKLEHADVTISFLTNIDEFFRKMAEPESPFKRLVNPTAVAEYFNRHLRTIGLDSAFNVESEGGPKAEIPKEEDPMAGLGDDDSGDDSGEDDLGDDDSTETDDENI